MRSLRQCGQISRIDKWKLSKHETDATWSACTSARPFIYIYYVLACPSIIRYQFNRAPSAGQSMAGAKDLLEAKSIGPILFAVRGLRKRGTSCAREKRRNCRRHRMHELFLLKMSDDCAIPLSILQFEHFTISISHLLKFYCNYFL